MTTGEYKVTGWRVFTRGEEGKGGEGGQGGGKGEGGRGHDDDWWEARLEGGEGRQENR